VSEGARVSVAGDENDTKLKNDIKKIRGRNMAITESEVQS
jgi:hypothetical protein